MTLTFSFVRQAPASGDTAVLCFSDRKKLDPAGEAFDRKTGGLIEQAIAHAAGFDGKTGQTLRVALPRGTGYKHAVILGIGQPAKLDDLAAETLGGHLCPALGAASRVSIFIPAFKDSGVKGDRLAAHMAYGIKLRGYTFGKYKTQKDKSVTAQDKKQILFAGSGAGTAGKIFKDLNAVAAGVYLARDVMNEPPNVLYPESYAKVIQREMKPLGVKVEILDWRKMQKLGFGAHLAIGMGSARKPCVVIMRWAGAKSAKGKAPIAFVGKGVTFDTGGISIKPAAGMEDMKMDMGGSAAVVGLMKALAGRKAKVNAVGIVGLAENMPSHNACRPGDIVKSLSGKTIEIYNTDAEGRLVLCDALTHIQRTDKPSHIIDLATLTGAMMVALGSEYCGAFVNNDKLWHHLESASKASGEKLWRMPLDEAYRKAMDGVISDLNNMGNAGRYGGACTAAGFLERFIENNTPWAHIDIAGKMLQSRDLPSGPKGGVGYGVKLLNRLVTDHFESR
jgi:leucyl aminopeptidase